MRALWFDGERLSLKNIEKPTPDKGETLIQVSRAGICNTDIEITKGYMHGFTGVPGHEFFGTIVHSSIDTGSSQRVTAEINCGCGSCQLCVSGDERHCLNRTVLGISGRNGAFSEFIAVPDRNIHTIPQSISDTEAIFIEPLAAAVQITEQISITPDNTVLLLGDGKLGQLIAHVIKTTGCDLTVIGKHPEKLDHLKALGIRTNMFSEFKPALFDIVIDASGSPEGLHKSISCVRPRGTLILKSTYANSTPFNPAPVIINEITLLGSRCGRFDRAIQFLIDQKPDFSYLIEKEYSLAQSLDAFEHACRKGSKKIVIDMMKN